MSKELVGAFGDGIFGSEEDCFIVRGPGDVPHTFKHFRQDLPGAHVFDLKLVLAVAGGIG